jgi:chemotaxis protein MotB
MSVWIRKSMQIMLVTGIVAAVGCQDPDKDFGPDQDAMAAADRIAELSDALDRCAQDRAAAEDRLLALQMENDQLRSELDNRGQAGEGWTSIPGGAMIAIEGTVLFESGKAELRSTGQSVLDGVAQTIRSQYGNHDIYVVGHTDDEPIRVSGWKDNYELSCQRALSVLRYLRGKGIGPNVAAAGWGEDRPVIAGRTAEARQRNRRVEIFAMVRGT